MRPDGAIARVRYERPHVSVYAHPAVFDVFREIAYRERRKAHELYLEAFALLLEKYGYDFNELNGR